jgi:protein gp37
MHPQWVRDIRDACVDAGVPFFFKQWGRFIPWSGADRAWRLPGSYTTVEADAMLGIDGQILEIPQGLSEPADAGELNNMIHGSRRAMCFDRVGKKKAGRVLDGRTWDEYPKREVGAPGKDA